MGMCILYKRAKQMPIYKERMMVAVCVCRGGGGKGLGAAVAGRGRAFVAEIQKSQPP